MAAYSPPCVCIENEYYKYPLPRRRENVFLSSEKWEKLSVVKETGILLLFGWVVGGCYALLNHFLQVIDIGYFVVFSNILEIFKLY